MACPDDETLLSLISGELSGLRLREVDGHLDGCALCQEIIATLASDDAEGPRSRRVAGDVIGRFTVLAPIGEGAMGAVYAAYDPELDRRVALKLLHSGDAREAADRERARARLVREAQALARLSHPNVVTVFDVGAEGDAVYVAMELVEGENLREWAESAERSAEEQLEVLLLAGRGLAAAHAQGLVHRDFKPENVLVDPHGVVKVTDFGLARVDEAELSEPESARGPAPEGALLELSLTRTGAMLGTPAYMSPEQLEGERAGPLSDQFAFAVTAWEVLTGARPYEADRLAGLRDALAAGPPQAPGALPRPAVEPLRRALSHDPSARHPDMGALLTALQPEQSRPRRLLGVSLAAAALVSMGVLGALSLGLADDPAPEPCAEADGARAGILEAERATQLRTAHEGRAAPLATAIEAWVERWSAARVSACEDTHVRHAQSAAMLDRRAVCLDRRAAAVREIARSFAQGGARASYFAAEAASELPDLEACTPAALADVEAPAPAIAGRVAEVEQGLDRVRAATLSSEPQEAETRARPLVEEATELGHAPLVAAAQLALAEVLRGTARYVEAEEAAYAALYAAEGARADRTAAAAWIELLRIAGAAGRYVSAARFARHAEAAIRRAGDPPRLRETLLQVRGVVRTNEGRLSEARADLEAARAMAQERLQDEGAPELSSLETSLGNVARLDERYPEALAHHRRALAMDEERLGPEHPRAGRDHHNIAGVLRRLERRDEARAEYDRALTIEQAALGSHPQVALTLNSLGLLAFEACEFDEARARYEASLAMFRAHDHGEQAMVEHNLALLDLELGNASEARDRLRSSIALDERRLGPDAKRVASALVALGRAHAALEEAESARAVLTRAKEIARSLGDVVLVEEADEALEGLEAPESVEPQRPARRRPAAPPPVEPPVEAPPEPSPPPQLTGRTARPAGSGSYGAGQAWD